MNISAGYSGGCSASIKTSVTTVQHERKKENMPSFCSERCQCLQTRMEWIVDLILAVSSEQDDGVRICAKQQNQKRGWEAHALLPLLQPGASSHTHQEAAAKSCSFIRGRDGADLTFCRCWSWGQSQLLPTKMLSSSLGCLKSKCWALSGFNTEKQMPAESLTAQGT